MNFVLKISKLLASHASAFIILVAIFTFFLPDTFGWVRGNTQTVILGIIMLTMGLTLSPNDIKIMGSALWISSSVPVHSSSSCHAWLTR